MLNLGVIGYDVGNMNENKLFVRSKKLLIVIGVFIVLCPQMVCAKLPYIVISKTTLTLYVIENSDTIFLAPICVGKNIGDKKRKGDCRTPEGEFMISQIQDSRLWKHDFNDGNGLVAGAYGPYFFRLKTPGWSGIGIHGTCFPHSVGTRDSEGCIRLRNEDLMQLRQLVSIGMMVKILPD